MRRQWLRRMGVALQRSEGQPNRKSWIAGRAEWFPPVVHRWSLALFTAILALASLGLMMWAGVMAWQRACRTPAGHISIGSPPCPSLILDLAPLLVALGFWVAGLLIVRFVDRPGLPDTFFLVIAGALAAGKLSEMGSYPGGRLFYLLLAWLVPLTLFS